MTLLLKKAMKGTLKKIRILAKETSRCRTHLFHQSGLSDFKLYPCKIADNIAHCLSQSWEICKAYSEIKKLLKGLFLDGMLVTREGWTVNFRPEVDNGCQAMLIHLSLVWKYNLHTHQLPMPRAMSNANGSPNKQKSLCMLPRSTYTSPSKTMKNIWRHLSWN